MNILKPLWVWNAIIFMLLLFQSGVYGGEIRVTGQVNPSDAQWNTITRTDNAERGIDVVLTSSAKIITNGEPFKLVARTLKADPGSQIIAFKLSATGGANGQSAGVKGSRGTHGKNAGNISFDVHCLSGYLYIDVQGQTGGRGGDGADGKRGTKGADEVEKKDGTECRCKEVCVSWFLWFCTKHETKCEKCPEYTPATHGSNGGSGGNAGPGGNGGDAGHVTLQVKKHYDAYLSIIYRGGEAGQAGQPGEGGEGGKPGKHKRLSKAQRGTKGRDGQYASIGRQGKGGKVQMMSLAHLEEQRKTLHQEIQALKGELKKTRAERDKLLWTLAEKYPLVRVWFENNFKRPYQFFKPDIHAGPNSEAIFRKLIEGLEQSDEPLSDNERNRLNKVRNDFLRLRMDNKIVGEIDSTIKLFEKQLTDYQKKLADALDWRNAKNWPLVGDDYEFKNKWIVADNKFEPSSCQMP